MRRAARYLLIGAALVASMLPFMAFARDADAPWWEPDGVQLGAGFGRHVQSAGLGLTWNTGWHRKYDSGALTAYIEADLASWRTSTHADDRSFTQAGVTPMLRFYPSALGAGWFVEGGIGANAIGPLYRNGDKRFSTSFNFGDRLGVGRRFGEREQHELALRIEHFSNASIKSPNPGENFLQVRYAYWF